MKNQRSESTIGLLEASRIGLNLSKPNKLVDDFEEKAYRTPQSPSSVLSEFDDPEMEFWPKKREPQSLKKRDAKLNMKRDSSNYRLPNIPVNPPPKDNIKTRYTLNIWPAVPTE